MQYSEKEHIINQIVSGCTICSFNNETVLVYEASPLDKVFAHNIYLQQCKAAELYGVATEIEMISQMKSIGLWNTLLEQELNNIPHAIEQLKIELYNAYFQFRRRDGIKKSLANLKYREVELIKKRDQLRHITCEGFALSCKNKHIICSGTRTLDNQPFFKNNYDDYSQIKIELFIQDYMNNKIDDNLIRKLSREEPWRSIWSSGKTNGSIFNVPSSLLSQEQRLLLVWSKVYDSVYENPDCPPEEVLDDDDCFDGWMLVQAKNRENERKSEYGYKPGDKFNKADEVFIPIDNPEDAARVEAMNSPTAIFRKQQRMSALTKHGRIEEQYMPDSQNTMREQLFKMQRERSKG